MAAAAAAIADARWVPSSQSSRPCCNWKSRRGRQRIHRGSRKKTWHHVPQRDELPLMHDSVLGGRGGSGKGIHMSKTKSTRGSSGGTCPTTSRTASAGSSSASSRNASRTPHGFGRFADEIVDLTARAAVLRRRRRVQVAARGCGGFSPGGGLCACISGGQPRPAGLPPSSSPSTYGRFAWACGDDLNHT